MSKRFFGASDVLVRMSQIVMRSRIAGSNRQRGWIERDGIQVSGLAVSCPWSFVGKAPQDPKARVQGIRHQGVINGFAVGDEFVEVLFVLQEFNQPRADFHPLPLRLGYRTGERPRFL